MRRIISFIYTFVLTITLAGTTMTYAGTDGQVTLGIQGAIDIAMHDNPELAQIQARFEAIKQIPSQVATLPDPVLSLGAVNFPTDTFSRTQEAMTQLQIGMSQQFPFPGKRGLREKVARLEANAASFSVDEMRLRLIESVGTTWWELFYLDRAIETIIVNQALLRQLIDVARTKYEDGVGLQQDVLLAQLELSKSIDQRIVVNALRQHQTIILRKLMGDTRSGTIRLSVQDDKTLRPLKDEQHLFRLAERSRPALRVKEEKVSAASARLSLEKKEYYPDFKVSLVYGERSGVNPTNDSRSNLLSIMLGVKIPLYAANKQSKAVEQRISEHQERNFALADKRLQVRADISAGVVEYHQAQEQFLLLDKGIIPQARQTVESMLAGYRVNKVDFLNLVRSQLTLFDHELRYWRVLTHARQATRRLEASIGEESIYE